MADVKELIIELTLDNKQIRASLKNTKVDFDKVNKVQQKQEGFLKKLSLKWIAFGAILTGVVAKGIISLIRRASDAEETLNKFNAVFSDIRSEANATAKELAAAFGFSSIKARELLADTGDLLTGFGFTQESALDLSKQVNTLAADLASFTNLEGGAERASQALTKALLGERESIKTLGIAILEEDVKAKIRSIEATGKLTNETERQKKAIATLAIATEQSKNAIGDFARSQSSTANQTRILKASIDDILLGLGSFLNNALKPLLPILNKVAGALAEWSEKNREINEVIKEQETILDNVDKGLLRFNVRTNEQRDAVKGLREAYDQWTTATKFLSKESLDFQKEFMNKDKFEKSVNDAKESVRTAGIEMTKFKETLKDTNINTGQQAVEVLTQLNEQAFQNAELTKASTENGMENNLTKEEQNELLRQFQELQTAELALKEEINTAEEEEEITKLERIANERTKRDQLAKFKNSLRQKELIAEKKKNTAILQDTKKKLEQEFSFKKFFNSQELQATQSALSDIAALTSSSNKTLFAIGKATSIASAIINVAQAITRTMASIPFPFNVPLAAGQAAAGAVQVSKISGTQLPTAQDGGVIDNVLSAPIRGEDGIIGVQRGESILTRDATVNLGRDTISALNQGQGLNINPNIQITVQSDNGQEVVDTLNDYLRQFGGTQRGEEF